MGNNCDSSTEAELARDVTARERVPASRVKRDADYVFYELTRSICPECRRVIDAQILIRN